MTKISGVTHEFRHGRVPGDNTCLYWSFLLTCKLLSTEIFGEDLSSKLLMEVLIAKYFKPEIIVAINQGLRIQVANYIRKNTDMHHRILDENSKYKTIEAYCSAIERGKEWGGDFELKALSDLYNILICVIYLQKRSSDNCLLPSYYGEDNELATKCVYIYHNGNHFDPLYIVHMENSDNKETIFDPNDQTVNDLLRKLIKEKCKYDVKLGVTIGTCINELSTTTNGSSESERVLPTERKQLELDNIPMSSNKNKQLPVEISVSNKRTKVGEGADNQMSTFYEKNSEKKTIQERIQVQDIRDESAPPVDRQQIEDVEMVLNNEYHEEKAECEEEPNNKVENVIEDDDKIGCNSKSSKAEPIS